MDFTAHYESPLGGMTMASDGEALVGLWFDGQRFFCAGMEQACGCRDGLAVFEETRRWLDVYFDGREPDFTPHLQLSGSAFRRRVWEMLLEIPYGKTTTYGEIARRIGGGMSAQAVGGAVGHNPISLIVPCHRVVGAIGQLTGYAGGVERKLRLLQLEGIR